MLKVGNIWKVSDFGMAREKFKEDLKKRPKLLYDFFKAVESYLKTGKNPNPKDAWFFKDPALCSRSNL